MGRILGLDWGTVRIGVALSDESGTIAQAYAGKPIKQNRSVAVDLRKLVGEYDVARIVIGLPKQVGGTEGASAQAVRAFGSTLKESLKLPIEYEDERFTTVQANKENQTSSNIVDNQAARVMLQQYLDRNKSHAHA